MRLGLIARAEDRGLGRMSWDAQRFLQPTATVIADFNCPYPKHLERFPGAPVVKPRTPEFQSAIEDLLSKVDVLLTFETPYDYDVYEWAKDYNVKTVCVIMPEYFPLNQPQPDVLVNPTVYMRDELPRKTLTLPWPIDLTTITHVPRTEINTWLHIVGQPCALDRNGTQLVLRAFQRNRKPLIVRTQTPLSYAPKVSNIDYQIGSLDHTSDLYQGADALIMPRRYAGQSLVMNEAQAAGLPLICLDRSPERNWTVPECRIPVRRARIAKRHSPIEVSDASIYDIMNVVDQFHELPGLCEWASNFSRDRAEAMSWDRLGPLWVDLLEQSV